MSDEYVWTITGAMTISDHDSDLYAHEGLVWLGPIGGEKPEGSILMRSAGIPQGHTLAEEEKAQLRAWFPGSRIWEPALIFKGTITVEAET